MRLFKRRNRHGQYVWYVDYYFQGKRFQRKVSEDKREAEDILAGIRSQINAETFKVPLKRRDKKENRCKIQTFDDLAREVFENFIKVNTAQPEKYRSRINTIGKFFAGKKLADITSFTIEQY